jgi:hypothetical protein
MHSRRRTIPTLLGLLAVTALAATACSGSDDHPLGEAVDIDGGSISVTAVEEGSSDELAAAFSLDPDQKAATPFYVRSEFVNDTDAPVDPGRPSGEDADGNLISPLVVIDLGGPAFEPCPGVPEEVAGGETAEGCSIVLVPPGVELERISYLPSGGGDFIYWSTE